MGGIVGADFFHDQIGTSHVAVSNAVVIQTVV